MEAVLKFFRRHPPNLQLAETMPALSEHTVCGCRAEALWRDPHTHVVIERLTFPPYVVVPMHRHPNVSALEFGVKGNGRTVLKRRTFANDDQRPAARPLYIARNRPHGGIAGAKGALVISVQYWHVWPPLESIGLDWVSE